MSVASSISSRNKRKRCQDETDVADVGEKIDIIMEKMEEIGYSMEVFREEFKSIAIEVLQDFKKDLMKAVREIVQFEIKKLTGINTERKIEQINVTRKQSSYAEKLKGSKTETVVVEPKEKQDSNETFIDVKRKVQIGRLGVGVERLKKTQAGKVVIGCVGKEDREKLASELKKNMGPKYNVRVTDKKSPKLKIIDVDSDTMENFEEMEIVEMIKKQNGVSTNEATKMIIKKKLVSKNKTGVIIMEVDPETHKFLTDKTKIKLDWNSCRVFDCVSILRCFKCWGFHHYAKDCKDEVKCRKCSENRWEKDCQNEIKKCVNCVKMVNDFKLDGIKTDHCANDLECECYKRAINRAQKNINYNY
ncbi:uncharacterized protein LOC123269592 [Cotesia glomerata]|uniref:uncharacterized protein LOC123269592 n=1 Tax=Cotesia glomerata TaxID=32391 RepID=UPI001D011CA0|nr:uncharacterized protein LOC123269592 [Cotesia glomerata]